MGQSTHYIKFSKNRIMQFGEWVFATTDTTVEVPTKLVHAITALATPEAYADSATSGGNVMFCDKIVTSGQITVSRKVDGGSATKFSYVFLGTMGATPGMVTSA